MVYEEDGLNTLGPYRMVCTYISFMLANIVVSQVKAISVKWMLTFGMLGYALNYSTEIYGQWLSMGTRYVVVGVGSMIDGFAESALWISLGRHIHLLCEEYGEVERKGQHYGLFSFIMNWSAITGALMIMFGLGSLPSNVYFIIVSGCSFVAFVLAGMFVRGMDSPNAEAEESIKQKLCNMLQFYPHMKPLFGLILIHGINIGFAASTIFHLMPTSSSTDDDNFRWGLILFIGGFGGMGGSYIGGKLCDIAPMKRVCQIGLVGFILSCLAAFLGYFIMNYYVTMIIVIMWGFQLCYISSCLMVCCSKLYNGAPEAFGIVNQFHCLSFLIY